MADAVSPCHFASANAAATVLALTPTDRATGG